MWLCLRVTKQTTRPLLGLGRRGGPETGTNGVAQGPRRQGAKHPL